MNLNQIRTQIKNITDYSPDLQAYSNQLDELINNAYYSLWRSKRWTFAQKQTFINAYPDISSDRVVVPPALPIAAAINDGQRLVTFSNAVWVLERHKDVYEGNIIELLGREYTIVKIIDETQLVVSEPIRITDPTTPSVNDFSWVVKARFYPLPEDCVEILSLAHRDIPVGNGGDGRILPPYGKLTGLLPRHDELLGLREDYASSYAEAYVPIPPLNLPPAETLTITYGDFGGPTDIPNSEYYEICWSFMSPEGQTSALSESVITQIQNGQNTTQMQINFLTFDGKPVQNPNAGLYNSGPGTLRQWEGLRKVLWYNANFDHITGERLGLPMWRQVINGIYTAAPSLNANTQDEPKTAEDTDASITIQYVDSFRSGTKKYKEYDGQHLRVRPYPRIDAWDFEYDESTTTAVVPPRIEDYFRRLELRYLLKPEPLLIATDVPQMPYEFHSLIVYGALEDIYNKNGNLSLAKVYADKIARLMKQLEKRYVDRTDMLLQKGQFGVSNRRFIYDQQSLKNKSL